MKKYKLVFLVLCFFLNIAAKKNIEDYELYVNEIVQQFSSQMNTEYKLVCIGDGGRMPHHVEEIAVKFIAYRKASVQEARELEVRATEALVKIINSHRQIKPYLEEFPFSPSRTEVSIAFNKEDNTRYDDGSVTYMFHVKDQIFYYTNENLIAKEPYKEAVKKIKNL